MKQLQDGFGLAGKNKVLFLRQPVPGVVPPARRTPVRPKSRSGVRRRLELLFLIGPAFVLFVGFVLIPIAVAVYYSFYKWSGFGPLNHPVGLANYRRAFGQRVAG